MRFEWIEAAPVRRVSRWRRPAPGTRIAPRLDRRAVGVVACSTTPATRASFSVRSPRSSPEAARVTPCATISASAGSAHQRRARRARRRQDHPDSMFLPPRRHPRIDHPHHDVSGFFGGKLPTVSTRTDRCGSSLIVAAPSRGSASQSDMICSPVRSLSRCRRRSTGRTWDARSLWRSRRHGSRSLRRALARNRLRYAGRVSARRYARRHKSARRRTRQRSGADRWHVR